MTALMTQRHSDGLFVMALLVGAIAVSCAVCVLLDRRTR